MGSSRVYRIEKNGQNVHNVQNKEAKNIKIDKNRPKNKNRE